MMFVVSGARGRTGRSALRLLLWILPVGALAAGCSSHATAPAPTSGRLEGEWGGPEASLVVDEEGARIELPCADGRIDGPIVLHDDRFEATGPWWPGPVPPNESLRARYAGRVVGSRLDFVIVAEPDDRILGPLVLVRDREPSFPRCQ
jgi:hypothetical protein